MENTGKEPFRISEGGDYRGASRSLRFKVTATDEGGHEAGDPDPSTVYMGGFVEETEIKPGGKFVVSVPLVRYREFDRTGRYTTRITHDSVGRSRPTHGNDP